MKKVKKKLSKEKTLSHSDHGSTDYEKEEHLKESDTESLVCISSLE
jgi:hypothetical protein